VRVESHLKQAAKLGHVGVIRALLGSEKSRQSFKEGQFKLQNLKLDLQREEAVQSRFSKERSTADLSPLAVALLEQETEAAKALIEAEVN